MAVAGSLDESGLFSNSTNVSSSTSANPTYTGWTQFCERHARASASDFAKSCIHYVNKNLPENVRATVSHRDFMMKFIECFSDHFDTEFSRRRVHNKTGNGSVTLPEETYYTDEIEIPKTAHKPFFRRLSFKGLRRGKALFHKQHSDELELSGSRQNKVKLSNIVVECRKEGSVQYLTPESLEHPSGPHKWEKCRLALVKTVSGYMLEFYSPPKSQQPRSGLFCFLILEARETTALEMPDHENTFVLKTDNNKDYVIEARDTDDMRSWLATIRYCMRGTPTSQIPPSEPDMSITTVLHENNVTSLVPEIPPRRHADRVSTSSNFELTEGDLEQVETDTDLTAEMRQYPWFHGTLPRSDAAGLVLHGGLSGHGVFLVRQSETRKGEFVLTFNFQGKAKHLRMTLNDLGQCRVQHLWFPTISEMLEYFGEHPIPLESGGTADVKLTEYVINAAVTKSLQALANNSQAGSNNSQAVANNSQAVADNSQAVADNSQAVANNSQAVSNNSQAVSNNSQAESNNSQAVSNNSQAVSNNLQGVSNNLQGVLNNLQASTHPPVITIKCSIRIKSCDLDLQSPHGLAQITTTTSTTQQQSSHNNNNTDSDTGRAVDNQYSFV